MEIRKNKKDRNFMCWFYFSKIGKTICKLESLFKNLTNNQYKTYLALIERKNLCFGQSFGMKAGTWIAENAQAIRFKKKIPPE
jgi:hypothetical protein